MHHTDTWSNSKWIGQYYLIRMTNSNNTDLEALFGYLNMHPKRASNPVRFSGSIGAIAIYIKCRPSELEDVMKNLQDAVDNTIIKSIDPSGYMTPETRMNWKNSILFSFYIYIATFFGSSTISGFMEKLDLNSPTLSNDLVNVFIKAAIVALPPTIVSFVLKKANKLEI